jgi:hypothetical protein
MDNGSHSPRKLSRVSTAENCVPPAGGCRYVPLWTQVVIHVHIHTLTPHTPLMHPIGGMAAQGLTCAGLTTRGATTPPCTQFTNAQQPRITKQVQRCHLKHACQSTLRGNNGRRWGFKNCLAATPRGPPEYIRHKEFLVERNH